MVYTSSRNQFSYYVFRKTMDEASKPVSFGSGTLFSRKWILTAAHCLGDAAVADLYLGAYQVNKKTEKGRIRQLVKKSNFFVHPEYNNAILNNDIALIKLETPIRW